MTTYENYETDTRARYQDPGVAASYWEAYAGSRRASAYPARIIAQREQRCISSALAACDPLPRTVLDIPCGTGKLASVLTHPGIQMIAGADISMEMMTWARRSYGLNGRFSGFTRCDATKLPFPDNSWDCVICLRLLHRTPPEIRRQILREGFRVSRKYAIVSCGIVDGLQSARLKTRRFFAQSTSVPSPTTARAFSEDIRLAGWELSLTRSVLPLLSCEKVFLLRKPA